MFIDFNRTTADNLPDEFLLENSNDIFTWIESRNDLFNLTNHKIYDICDIANHLYDFHFYEDENDADYLGVWVIE